MNKRIRKKQIRNLLLAELAMQFESADDAVVWLETPMEKFEGRTPRATIAAGEVERVMIMLDEMNAANR